MRFRALTGALMVGALVFAPAKEASATDGHFLFGVGAISAAMGGANTAAPVDLLGTFYLNPAGLMAFDGFRSEFSFELFKPDRTVSSEVTGLGGDATRSVSDFVPIPAIGLTAKLNNEKVVLGIGALGIGGFGVNYAASTTNPILTPQPNGFGQVYSDYSLMKFTPAVAFAPSEKIWVGAALNVDWARLTVMPAPFASPDVDAGPPPTAFYPSASAADGAFGFGFQVGLLWKINDMFNVGAAYTSEQWFEEFNFQSTVANPNLATFGTPREFNFKLNVPAMVSGGLAVYALPNLLLSGDFRYYFYESTPGFEVPETGIVNPDFSVAGFGWTNIYSIHAGFEWWPVEKFALRGGYNYSQNPIPDSLAMFNVPAPAIVQHHASVGLGWQVTRRFQISAAYYRAFENTGTGPLINLGTGAAVGTVTNALKEDSFLLQFSLSTRGMK